MKTKHIMTLLQEGFTTIKVRFPSGRGVAVTEKQATSPLPSGSAPWEPSRPAPTQYGMPPQAPMPSQYDVSRLHTYKALMSDNVKVGDTVAVIVGKEMLLVSVAEVHDLPQIDLDADFDYKWIVQKIDTTAYDKMAENEKQFQLAMVEVERAKQREKVKQEMEQLLIDSPIAKNIFEGAVKSLNQIIEGEKDADK